ncbi:hypothetical protein A9K55_003865 [Cordyceps militaris]|uniref:Uncharacterized protein n=1 Tax=Cordyceps militaris TaxID=73501 RepID=A0A2H4SPQ0_CORMI|nr:hypothetical protein A9K55_003865 [Cordyceps militaris]
MTLRIIKILEIDMNNSVNLLNKVFLEKRRISNIITSDSKEFYIIKDILYLLIIWRQLSDYNTRKEMLKY